MGGVEAEAVWLAVWECDAPAERLAVGLEVLDTVCVALPDGVAVAEGVIGGVPVDVPLPEAVAVAECVTGGVPVDVPLPDAPTETDAAELPLAEAAPVRDTEAVGILAGVPAPLGEAAALMLADGTAL